LRLFSFGGYGLALAALALVVFGAIPNAPRHKPIIQEEPLPCRPTLTGEKQEYKTTDYDGNEVNHTDTRADALYTENRECGVILS